MALVRRMEEIASLPTDQAKTEAKITWAKHENRRECPFM
jgi:hypothetical protein